MPLISVPRDIVDFARVFSHGGFRLFVVGGAVRDSLIGRVVSDFDAATDARPEEVLALFRRVVPTGMKHGTVTVLWKGRAIETTTFRSEAAYSDGRRPDSVEFGATIEEDLERRDFTINAMAWDPIATRLVDPFDGRGDILRRTLRAVGDPRQRFSEDGLRVLRVIRFAAQLNFEIEEKTFAAISPSLAILASVSAERVRDELSKILLSASASSGFLSMEKTGILALLLPEIASCRGVEQRGMHSFDVLDHSLLAVDAMEPRLELRLAALLHDIGKPEAKAFGADGIPTFYRHEEISARVAESILRRLRFPNEVIALVVHLVREHMFHYEDGWTDAAVRRFIARVRRENLDDLLALRMADSSALAGKAIDPRGLDQLRQRVDEVAGRKTALGLRDLAIGGEDLAALGVPRSPVMGRMLAELLEAVLDDPSLNTRKTLIDIASKLRAKHGLPDLS